MSFFGGDSEEPFSVGEARVVRETAKAVLIEMDDELQAWVPKSAIHDDSEVYGGEGKEGELIVKAWFARKEGWD